MKLVFKQYVPMSVLMILIAFALTNCAGTEEKNAEELVELTDSENPADPSIAEDTSIDQDSADVAATDPELIADEEIEENPDYTLTGADATPTPAEDLMAEDDSIPESDSIQEADSAPQSSEAAPMAASSFNADAVVVHFDYNRATLSAASRSQLQSVIMDLKNNPSLRIEVAGHTDERGSRKYNANLGNRRARAVKKFLVDNGVPSSRVKAISLGESQPIAQGSSEDVWQQNRRATFTVGGSH